ncbi:MAG: FecR domain-containing protein [Pyrinomonadaceae bacterium]
MKEKHYKSKLSAFVNHELSKAEQLEIAEHLMQCSVCRSEHDRVKLGAAFAGNMERADAPARVWNEIESVLENKRLPQMTVIPRPAFGFRNFAGYAVALLLVASLVSAAYFTFFRAEPNQAQKEQSAPHKIDNTLTKSEVVVVPVDLPANVDQPNSNTPPSNENTNTAPNTQPQILASVPAFEFETISGTPKVGAASSSSRLAVGDYMETDGASRARIEVADIGNVEIQPNSRVRLVGTNPKQHRLSLERGVLEAKIIAPPRLFIVDTPSAVAVDLGCAYKLEVDKAGNSYLHVTSGFVALERGGRESIVPAGAMCITKRGKGLGTPFSADTSDKFRAALERFDFSNGRSRSIDDLLANRNFYDMISLWHLLSRVQKADRAKIFDALAAYVTPPADVTRDGILSLDKTMLTAWKTEVERIWFE